MMHLMKVLHVTKFYPPHIGGIEMHLRDLARELRKSIEIEILVANDCSASVREERDGVFITRVSTYGRLASQPLTWGLTEQIRRSDADIVHIHTPDPLALIAFIRSRHKTKLVITHHGDTVGREVLKLLVLPWWRAAMDRASAIIVGSRSLAESSDELGPYRHKWEIIPFGIDYSFLRSNGPLLTCKSPIVLYVGRLVPWKGIKCLIEAMNDIDATLLIVGDGPQRKELEARSSRDTHFLGPLPQSELGRYYRAARVLVLPSVSRNESFGFVQLEAMYSGCPVINTNLRSGVPDVSQDGVTGMTVPPGDPIALRKAIRAILENDPLRDKFSGNAERRAREFSLESMTSRTLMLYESVLAR
jgi:rhamnosyl/mannosyltransferase